MDWLLWIGIGLLVYGAWIWFQRNRPNSPLLYDDALIEYTAIQTIKMSLFLLKTHQRSFLQNRSV